MRKVMAVAGLGVATLAAARMEHAEIVFLEEGEAPVITLEDLVEHRRAAAQANNINAQDQAESNPPKSRQQRRQLERLRRKGRV